MRKVTRSSGNVFADLGLKKPRSLLAKAEALGRLGATMKARGLSRARVAALTGLGRREVADLLGGRVQGYSLRQLEGFVRSLAE